MINPRYRFDEAYLRGYSDAKNLRERNPDQYAGLDGKKNYSIGYEAATPRVRVAPPEPVSREGKIEGKETQP